MAFSGRIGFGNHNEQGQGRNMMNVLLTSVGRRSYLVRYFQAALAGRGRVVAANSVAEATGMIAADKAYVIPQASQAEYIEQVLDICRQEQIGLLCSLHDWEGPFLAENLKRFEALGVVAVVSSPRVMDICLDKAATVAFCETLAIRTPRTWTSWADVVAANRTGQVQYPLIIKPRCGQGSIELHVADNEGELSVLCDLVEKRLARYASNGLLTGKAGGGLVIQQVIRGPEYGLDVVNDLNGRFAACFVKRKLAMRAGETDAAETAKDAALEALGRKIGERLGHVGVLDVDVMVDEQGPCLLEMNARFGGHYPFSHEAGANIPAALIAWAEGKTPNKEWLTATPGIRAFKDIAIIRSK